MTTDGPKKRIREAMGAWTGADWRHEMTDPRTGRVLTLGGGLDEPIYCEGEEYPDHRPRKEVCGVCASVAEDVLACEMHANDAIRALERGDIWGALDDLRACERIEGQYGDAPTWRPVREIVEALTRAPAPTTRP